MKQGIKTPVQQLFYFYIISVFLAASCTDNIIYEKNLPITPSGWDYKQPVYYHVKISDTVSPHNLSINIRHNGSYVFSNIYLFISVLSPAKNVLRDTVNCILADNRGKWYGSSAGGMFSNKLSYKKNVFFPDTGIYTFSIEHAMRKDVLENIEDIGICIEKAL